MTTKEQVLALISKMPDSSTLNDIGYELYTIESIQEGLDQLDRGEYLSHSDAKKELSRWLKD